MNDSGRLTPGIMCIVLLKMFSRWFFANKKIIIRSTALKLCNLTDDIINDLILRVTFDVMSHHNTHCPQMFTENAVGSTF